MFVYKVPSTEVVKCVFMDLPHCPLGFSVLQWFGSCVSASVFLGRGGSFVLQAKLYMHPGDQYLKHRIFWWDIKLHGKSSFCVLKKSNSLFNLFLQVAFFWSCSLRLLSIPTDTVGESMKSDALSMWVATYFLKEVQCFKLWALNDKQ